MIGRAFIAVPNAVVATAAPVVAIASPSVATVCATVAVVRDWNDARISTIFWSKPENVSSAWDKFKRA